MTRSVLVVDDDAAVGAALAQTLELAGLVPHVAGSFVAAKDHITRSFDGVILSDLRMPGRDGFHLLGHTQSVDRDLPVILLTGEGDIPMAVRAMNEGAFSFLEKPCAPAALLAVIRRALDMRAMVLDNRRMRHQLETGDPAERLLFGVSDAIRVLRARMRSVAAAGVEVLVTGPAGSGVAKVAEIMHMLSPRAEGPFVKRAAAGLDVADLQDQFRSAQGGTAYLDEIGALPGPTQYAMLEALEQGSAPRVIGGTTADLGALMARGDFNAELYYRLDVTRVRMPALSERPEDIPVLFRHYVEQAAEQAGIPVPDIAPEHLARLMAQDWPGNARSLMSAAMRFVLGMPEEIGTTADLGLAGQMAQVERSLLIAALGRQNGRVADAARVLRLPRKTLYDKLARYGIRPEDYRR